MKTHSTLSRREFMKALGFTAAGAVAVGAAMPVVHDLDELIASDGNSKLSMMKRPWWVKQRPLMDPTVEIDWSVIHRFNRAYEMHNNFGKSRYTSRAVLNTQSSTQYTADKRAGEGPGWNVKWRALANGVSDGSSNVAWSFTGRGASLSDTPADMGIKNLWKGTPEESARLLYAAMRYYGAIWIGFQEMNQQWREKLIVYSRTGAGTGTDWDPVTHPEIPDQNLQRFTYDDTAEAPIQVANTVGTGNRAIIPTKKQQYIISFATGMDMELQKCPDSTRHTPNSSAVANFHNNVAARTANFVRSLTGDRVYGNNGHQSSETNFNGLAVFAGIAEHSRQNNFAITPESGASYCPTNLMTDFPVAPTNPIDAGIWKFCQTCGKCAEVCPSGSIAKKSEGKPTYELIERTRPDGVTEDVRYKMRGIKAYCLDWSTCNEYTATHGACSYCYGNCTFTEDKAAMIHNMVRATVANTSLFNGFFAGMSEPFGFGHYEDPDIWWEMSLPAFGYDTTIGTAKGSYYV